ncbi:MAG: DUF1501 domain-containing protein [Shimia sp.]
MAAPTDITRRRLLLRATALGCTAAASPLATPLTLASAPWDTKLVVIILRGALDGLDAVRPVGDPAYAALRPSLADGAGLPLDGYFALHPALAPLMPLWEAGEFGVAHAVSTPYRDKRSHFDGQDLLEAGVPSLDGGLPRDGWLNRLMQITPGATAQSAFAVGQGGMRILQGPGPHSTWRPDTLLRLSPQAERLLDLMYHDDALFRDAANQARDILDTLEGEGEGMDGGGSGRLTGIADFVASRLRRETAIAAFSLGGWDTHSRQARVLPRRLTQLSEVILALRAGLGKDWARTAVLCVTEFGRTVRENGTGGTDHGTGGVMLAAGGAVRGGRVFGAWPGLGEGALYADRDLMPTRDVRAHLAWTLHALTGTSKSALEGQIFPGLDMGADPGIIRP